MNELETIKGPIKEDLTYFETEFKQALNSDVKLINSISGFLVKNRGKRIRPILTLLCARLCDTPSEYSYKAAAMMELLHVATLIHDDIVDDAKMRRGKPSIKQVWKNKISVLMGDFILSKALINMVNLKNFDALDLISKTAEKLSAGEIMQIEKSLTRNMPKEVYYDMINQKTASLIAASCELGAITTTNDNSDRKSTFKYGNNLGMAFQIKDDLFDFLGSENETGKDAGGDVVAFLAKLSATGLKEWEKTAKSNSGINSAEHMKLAVDGNDIWVVGEIKPNASILNAYNPDDDENTGTLNASRPWT